VASERGRVPKPDATEWTAVLCGVVGLWPSLMTVVLLHPSWEQAKTTAEANGPGRAGQSG